MTAKEYLNRYRVLNERIDCKYDRIRCIRSKAARMTPTAMFDHNGNVTDKVGTAAAKIADLEREAENLKAEAAAVRAEIERTVSEVDDAQLRDLLTMRYIHGYGWRKIAGKMKYSEKHITGYLHRKALKKIEKLILFGVDFNTRIC